MTYELRRLSINDGNDVYEMLQELPKDENGFINSVNGKTFDEYKQWLVRSDNTANGIGLESWMVPQTIYWLYVDGTPVGFGKLRHCLTEKLKAEGGHAGYAIRPSQRGKGYGKLLLKRLIVEAGKMNIDRMLLTIRNGNEASIRTALSNGGIIEKANEERHYVWITCL